MLLLDEPTSALDQRTQARVFGRLRMGLPGTCVIASIHRLSALGYFDKVIVMADGRIVDAGPVADVLDASQRARCAGSAHAGAPAPAAAAAS